MTAVRDAAKEYFGLGFYPIPLMGTKTEDGKKPAAISWPPKRPKTFPKDWFTNGRNVGLICGEETIIIDGDSKDALAAFCAEFKIDQSKFPVAKTKRGYHLYARGRPGCTRKQAFRPKLDVLAGNGYGVAPPSNYSDDGTVYEWITPITTEVYNLPVLPEAFWSEYLNGKKATDPTTASDITEGVRNATLYKEGCALRGRGHHRTIIEHFLHALNKDECDPPLTTREVDVIITQVMKHPRGVRSTTIDTVPQIQVLSFADVLELPDPTWLIDGLLPAHGTSTLYGHFAAGKTFIALDWALHLACGIDWLGHAVAEPVKVCYVIGEGARGFKQRLTAWKFAHHSQNADVINTMFIPHAVNLYQADWVDTLAATMQPHDPGLYIFDTLTRNTVGADENSTRDMAMVLEHLTHLGDRMRLLVHHVGWAESKRTRGASALPDNLDAAFFVERDPTKQQPPVGFATTITCAKQKDAEPFVPVRLLLIPEAQSLVVSHNAAARTLGTDEEQRWDDIEDFLREMTPATKTQVGKAIGRDPKLVGADLAAMAKQGRVKNEGKTGSGNKGRWVLGPKAKPSF